MNPAKTALVSFLVPIIGFLVGFQIGLANSLTGHLIWQLLWNVVFFVLLQSGFVGDDFEKSVTIHSIGLGFQLSFGCQLVVFSWCKTQEPFPLPVGLMLFTLAVYHFTEFVAIALKNPNTVGISDFVLKYDFAKDRPDGPISRLFGWLSGKTYRGIEHHLALLIPLSEFIIETIYYPQIKFSHLYISYLGFAICMGAEVIRKAAMITAGRNFNHVVQEERKADHVLVTEGLYSRWRHPSYVGQFYWCLGTQIMLLNPFSTIIITVAVWFFLQKRIAREEIKLVEFFGSDYIKYRTHVSSGIPGIK